MALVTAQLEMRLLLPGLKISSTQCLKAISHCTLDTLSMLGVDAWLYHRVTIHHNSWRLGVSRPKIVRNFCVCSGSLLRIGVNISWQMCHRYIRVVCYSELLIKPRAQSAAVSYVSMRRDRLFRTPQNAYRRKSPLKLHNLKHAFPHRFAVQGETGSCSLIGTFHQDSSEKWVSSACAGGRACRMQFPRDFSILTKWLHRLKITRRA